MIPRYQAMKGHKTIRKAGWDTHGLPVELEVEKLLGINGKEQIEEYGIEPFVEKCKWRLEIRRYVGRILQSCRLLGRYERPICYIP